MTVELMRLWIKKKIE